MLVGINWKTTLSHPTLHSQLPEDGGPLTIQWMQGRLEEISGNRSRILSEKRNDNAKLAKHKESVLSELEKLRTLNRAHRRLMVEIWPHLTALARVSHAKEAIASETSLCNEGKTGELFNPLPTSDYHHLSKPIRIYMGEFNIRH